MIKVKIIERDGEDFALVPIEIWDQIVDVVHSINGTSRYQDSTLTEKAPSPPGLPGVVVMAHMKGTGILNAWCSHRGIPFATLAAVAGMTELELRAVELTPSKRTAKALVPISLALGIPTELVFGGYR